jgi:hypothetical protein
MIHQVLGVAVIAARRDFLAPDPRIERMIAPFNLAVFTHGNTLHLKVGSRLNIRASIVNLQALKEERAAFD